MKGEYGDMDSIDFEKIELEIQKEIDRVCEDNEMAKAVRSVALEISMIAIQEYHEELIKKVLGNQFR